MGRMKMEAWHRRRPYITSGQQRQKKKKQRKVFPIFLFEYSETISFMTMLMGTFINYCILVDLINFKNISTLM